MKNDYEDREEFIIFRKIKSIEISGIWPGLKTARDPGLVPVPTPIGSSNLDPVKTLAGMSRTPMFTFIWSLISSDWILGQIIFVKGEKQESQKSCYKTSLRKK